MTQIFVGVGSNLGDREDYIRNGVTEIGHIPGGTRVIEVSSLYETDAVTEAAQPPFLNAVIKLETGLGPERLLENLLRVENEFGRVRTGVEAPRTLDLDLLFFGDRILKKPGLVVPHPRLHLRRFVLMPLAEIAPEWEHPVFKKSVQELLKEISSDFRVSRYPPAENQKAAAR